MRGNAGYFGLIPFIIVIPLFLIAFKPLGLMKYLVIFNIFWFIFLTIGILWMGYGVFKGNLTFWGDKNSVISGGQELFFLFSPFFSFCFGYFTHKITKKK